MRINRPVPAYENLITNEILARLSEANLAALDREVVKGDAAGVGSTDMGNVSKTVPSAPPFLELSPGLTLHTREAAEAAASSERDKAVVDGALLLAMIAVELFSQPKPLSAARATFEQGGYP